MNRSEFNKFKNLLDKNGSTPEQSEHLLEVDLSDVWTADVKGKSNQHRKKLTYKEHLCRLEVLIEESTTKSSLGEPINEVPICVTPVIKNGVLQGYKSDDGHHRLAVLKRLKATKAFVSTYKADNTPDYKKRMEKEKSNDHPVEGLATDDETRRTNIRLMVSEDRYFEKLPNGVVAGVRTPVLRPDESSQESINKWATDCAKIYKDELPNCAKKRDWIENQLKKGLLDSEDSTCGVVPVEKTDIFDLVKTGQNPAGWKSEVEVFTPTAMSEECLKNEEPWRIVLATSPRQLTKDCLANIHAAKTKNKNLKVLVCYGTGNMNYIAPDALNAERLKVIKEFDNINNSPLHENSGMKLFDDICFYPQITQGKFKDASQYRMTTKEEVLKKNGQQGSTLPSVRVTYIHE